MKRKKEAKKEKKWYGLRPCVSLVWASPLCTSQYKGMGYAHGSLFFRFWEA
jgi:hypothetical protein